MAELTAERHPAAGPAAPTSTRGWRDRLGVLFPTDKHGPATRRTVIWAVVAVIVGTVVSLGRVGGPGPFNSIWAEDGSDYLTDALNRDTLRTIVRPLNGYFVLIPRLLAIPAGLVPPEWGPAVLSVEAAVVTALTALIVYVASRAHLRSVLARAVAAVPVLVVPVGENLAATLANNVATLQFAATYTLLWVLLWAPATRTGRITAVLVAWGVAFTTILAAVLIPLALVRLYLRRDRTSLALAGGLTLGAVADLAALALHLTSRPAVSRPHYDPFWALQQASWALRNAMFGDRGANGVGADLVGLRGTAVVAGLILVAVLLVAAFRWTRPSWLLAVVMGVHALVYWCLTLMAHGRLEMRYVAGPELMLFAGMAALLLPALPRRWAYVPLAMLATFIAVICTLNYQAPSGRTISTPWRSLVAQARIACTDPQYGAVYVYPNWDGKVEPIPIGTPMPRRTPPPYGFPVWLPCHRLRG